MANKPIVVKITDELFSGPGSYLTSAASASDTTLTVKDITGFAVNKILLIGEVGEENAEVINVHASTAPSGTTITLASGLSRAHSVHTKVREMYYDQVEFSHASTATGSKSVLATVDIDTMNPDGEVVHSDTTQTSGFYFARFKNSIDTTYSDYTDAIPYGGLARNTVGYIIDYALKRNKLSNFTEHITHEFCIEEVNACLEDMRNQLRRWTKYQEFDYVLGQTARGQNNFTLPSDIYDNNSNRSILAVRIGEEGTRLEYRSKNEWEEDMDDVKHTQVRTAASVGDTTLEIDNSYDFDDSGSVNVYISGTKYNITYTGVTRSATAGVLTGVPASGTGSITVTVPVDTDVWQDETEGMPTKYTVYEGVLYIGFKLPDPTHDDKNVYLDYWTTITEVDSDADTLDVTRYDMAKHWLTWAIRSQLKNEGQRDFNDGDYLMYREMRDNAVKFEVVAQKSPMYPRKQGISYG